jgi:hypothetical protein
MPIGVTIIRQRASKWSTASELRHWDANVNSNPVRPQFALCEALRSFYALFDRPICELFQVAGANRSAKSSLFFSQSDVAFGSFAP